MKAVLLGIKAELLGIQSLLGVKGIIGSYTRGALFGCPG